MGEHTFLNLGVKGLKRTHSSLILCQDVIEVYPLSSIGQVQAISDDRDLSSVLVFCTMQTEHKYAAMHLFQSERLPVSAHYCTCELEGHPTLHNRHPPPLLGYCIQVLFTTPRLCCTVEPPLAGTSHKWTPPVSGHQSEALAIS